MSTSSSPATTNMKGYAFGLVTNTEFPAPSLAPFFGRSIANETIDTAVYKENMHNFSSAFVYEFPTLQDAKQWYEDSTQQDAHGPVVLSEGEEFGDAFGGYSIFFIKVEDKESFQKYNPKESLRHYESKPMKVPVAKATCASTAASNFDAAVLIAFKTAQDGKEWLESDEYKPQGELRLAATSGHGVVIGKATIV
ncbi:MAG: hypothetical protein SGILL_004191 [Bacillariaceae sp.]